jgi:hypothetical protein
MNYHPSDNHCVGSRGRYLTDDEKHSIFDALRRKKGWPIPNREQGEMLPRYEKPDHAKAAAGDKDIPTEGGPENTTSARPETPDPPSVGDICGLCGDAVHEGDCYQEPPGLDREPGEEG